MSFLRRLCRWVSGMLNKSSVRRNNIIRTSSVCVSCRISITSISQKMESQKSLISWFNILLYSPCIKLSIIRLLSQKMYTLLRQDRLRWLGHVHRMPDGHIPKDFLYGELASGKRSTGRPQLRYRDLVQRDMKTVDISTESWESLAANRSKWKGALTTHLKSREEKLPQAATERRARRKQSDSSDRPETLHTCDLCNRECRSRIGLYSHRRRCSSQAYN